MDPAAAERLKEWFQSTYETLLGASQGPRLGSFIALYGIENSRKLIDQILQCTESLEQLFDNLLDISRLDAGALKPELMTFRIDVVTIFPDYLAPLELSLPGKARA